MISIVVGSEGLLGSRITTALIELSSTVYTFDLVEPSTVSAAVTHQVIDVSCEEFVDQIIQIISKHEGEDFSIIYTPAYDYPVRNGESMPISRYELSVNEILMGFHIGFFPLICFDSIYSTHLPKRNFYKEGIKPIAYSITKAPISILGKSYSSEFSRKDNSSRFYALKLSTVASDSLPKQFINSFKHYSSVFDLIDIDEVVSLTSWLVSNKPLAMSGTVINLTSGYGN